MTRMKKPVLEIKPDAGGILKIRPNRFLGIVDIVKPETLRGEKVHILDPGRLEDILYPGNRVLLKKADNKNRKTKWDLIAGRVGENWVLTDSSYHRKIAEWAIRNEVIPPFEELEKILPEQRFGESRLDFLLEKKGNNPELEENKGAGKRIWVEVKGCTLSENGTALFPDAPTTRGKRHVEELIKALKAGDQALILILIFRPDAECFAPNREIDPAFAEAFERAVEKGVMVYPLVFEYEVEGKTGYLYFKREVTLCRA
ncbi:DNA/RNA nuclease SfsA [Methanosarcina sp. KYL-1]|uniref:DNA/RNA nuclease SfsA n=1 Tax=Methanosarcina sp. KYL-1 TaxID=2602068 RepID=UPI0021013833|nr:DNA/RNA nuclease SfsA [Methanosarcina sp. KYL-1]MCQ1536556.1 DNA/RNA nuclease SfsA [Methanosarcina sp. KYL-1]